MMTDLFRSRPVRVSAVAVMVIVVAHIVLSAEKRDARVTQIVHDVRILPSHASARPASLNESI